MLACLAMAVVVFTGNCYGCPGGVQLVEIAIALHYLVHERRRVDELEFRIHHRVLS